MKIILNDDVYNLGEEGDVREVKPGYARNYLIPQGLAVPFNKGNAAKFERRKDAIEKRKEEKRKDAMGLKDKIDALELSIPMPAGDTGKLFGSVTNATVSDALAKEGIHIERKKIDLPEHNIKMIGKYKVRVKLYENSVGELVVLVVDEKTGSIEPVGSQQKAAPVAAAAAQDEFEEDDFEDDDADADDEGFGEEE